MAITRGDMKRRIRLMAGELPDTPAWSDPLGLDEALITACDHVAQEADCFWTYFDFDLTGTSATPQTEVCLAKGDWGELYKIKSARLYKDATSSDIRLFREGRDIVTAAWMDHHYPEWREAPLAGSPDYLVLQRPDMLLYPLVDYSRDAGLRLWGFGTPGRLWNPANILISDDDVFPLPNFAREAVETYAICNRCLQYPSKESMLRYDRLIRRFDEVLLPDVEHKAAAQYAKGSL